MSSTQSSDKMQAKPGTSGRSGATPPRTLKAETFMLGGLELVVLTFPIVPESPSPTLTRAERHVVELLTQGFGTREIAIERGTSLHTVSNQLATIYRKFGVSTRQELLAKF